MNRRGRSGLAAAVAVLCAAFPARGAGRAECLSMPSRILGRDAGYCVILPPGYGTDRTRRFPVLYFLHGLGGNQFMFVQNGGLNLVEDLWDRRAIGQFLIVTPNAGNSFYINSRDGRVRYEDFLLREFFPFIERRYRVEPGRRFRGIAGISMGGYGALHLAFRHPEMFGSVSAESAALIERLPEVRLASPQQRAARRILGGAFGSPPSPAFWDRNSPLTLARTFHLAGLKIYFDCGAEDDFGFNQGAESLDKILSSRGIPHQFHLYPGGHNWVYFAQRLPETLEFQSAAFGSDASGN